MKYIKKFFEELDPQKFIRAGEELKTLGKMSRGSKLIDHGLKQLYGSYNVHLGASYGNQVFSGWFSKPVCNFYYGFPKWQAGNANNNYSRGGQLTSATLDEEAHVKNWKNGDSLGFTLDFRFEPSQEFLENKKLKINDVDEKLLDSRYPISRPRDFSPGVPFFSFIFTIAYGTDESFDSIGELYDNYKVVDLSLSTQINPQFFGIFSDRKSALDFKRLLPNLVRPHTSKIMDLLSIVEAPVDDLENILDTITSVSVNQLYLPEADYKMLREFLNRGIYSSY